ncbi:MAG: CoA-binding protein [Desulfobacteraceae bacterium]|nr:MAG: CoA-binding protein [Desulfobacteraceae bacterium]
MKETRCAHSEIDRVIGKSIESGSYVICEDEAKSILRQGGVEVVDEIFAKTGVQAVEAARSLGFPVVLKGVGPELLHKTESGMVRVGLQTEADLMDAAQSMTQAGSVRMDGFLVQPQVLGRRELVAGMFRDDQFGPVIMFGLGGIYTEALKDTVFKIAPLTQADMEDMFAQLQAKVILDEFRGEKPVDRQALKATLQCLSDLAVQHPAIREIDVNPLIVDETGRPVAVDALILTQDPKKTPEGPVPLTINQDIARSCFYPRSIAFIGASAGVGKWGHMLLTNTLNRDYKGEIFLVNPKGGTIAGRKVYAAIDDIDATIDLAVVTIPAHRVIDLIPALERKKTQGMLVITSGFREVGPDGHQLEDELVAAASKAGIVILGPNTMGICNPHIDLFCSGVHVYPIPGSTALVCQSGNMGTQLMAFAEQQGIGIRAFSGSGNEAMVTIEDYMEAFETDELTRTVVLYLESVKDGKRFFNSAARVSKQKPVVVLKGGRTSQGTQAASSHTGALASDTKVFEAACRQAGIIQVTQPIELLDLSAVFSSLPLPKGNRVAIMTLGGGWGVITTDLCEENNLVVPQLPQSMVTALDQILPDYWSRGNPVDIVGESDPSIPLNCMEALLKWDGCDAVIHLGIHGKRILVSKMMDSIMNTDPGYKPDQIDWFRQAIEQFEEEYTQRMIELTTRYDKPVLGVSLLTDADTRTLYRKPDSPYKAVYFPSPERAVKALQGMVSYSGWLEKHRG